MLFCIRDERRRSHVTQQCIYNLSNFSNSSKKITLHAGNLWLRLPHLWRALEIFVEIAEKTVNRQVTDPITSYLVREILLPVKCYYWTMCTSIRKPTREVAKTRSFLPLPLDLLLLFLALSKSYLDIESFN